MEKYMLKNLNITNNVIIDKESLIELSYKE